MAGLLADGIEPSSNPRSVALLGESTPRGLALLYALIEMKIPVAMVDPRSSVAERRGWLADVDARAFIDPSTFKLDTSPREDLPRSFPGDDEVPLAIVRTSGSAGRPKGVVLSRRAFLAAAAASTANLGWCDEDRWLLSLPIAHVGGLSIVTRCLAARRTVVLRPIARFSAAEVAEILVLDRVTHLSLVPTTLQRLLDLKGFELPSHVRAILLGGAAVPARLRHRSAERGWPVLATYGLTEACSQVATQRYGRDNLLDPGAEPIAGMEVRIRDSAIEIRGPNLMTGYLPAGDTSPFDAAGWFATGDFGRLDATGRLHVLGRRDDVIISGGENVHPREVEEALGEHPAVDAACVFGVPDDEWGQAVAAALVSASPPVDGDLARHLGRRLAAHQRPKYVVYLAQLPTMATGKVDRRELTRLARSQLRRFTPGRSELQTPVSRSLQKPDHRHRGQASEG